MNESKIPKLLQEIPDKPKKLYMIGEFPDQDNNIFLTVIGSRKYTQYGKSVCEKLIAGLAGYPFVIVSGLALGIDGIAHRAALDNNLTTIAIPGSGLDASVLYPASHRNLVKDILNADGCLMSELEPMTKAAPWTFPQRNRIMAGLSHAVLVIEAENKSGTRITARLATEYNREVFSVPGSIFSTASEGCNELIREGATPITSARDILDHFHLLDEKNPTQQQMMALEPNEQLVIDLLNEPTSRNVLAEKLDIPIMKINILLSSMEIKGLIAESMGKICKK
ncbi:MAG: DNA-processing protein DprA [Candidatus Pacebacteria bacterium]|nr:DNA-processing protein DprA [Candidatus Paceibacterota bacterium]